MRLFTFRKSFAFTSKVETRFMREGIELWTSFVLSRRLNTKSLFCEGSALDDVSPILILAKTKGLGCSSFFNLWTEGFGILPFPILLNTESCWRDINGCNLSNTDVRGLVLALSPSSLSTSSAVIYCVRVCLSLRHPKTLTGWGGT